jgi:tetratricopeptide (TPR) repeat protein
VSIRRVVVALAVVLVLGPEWAGAQSARVDPFALAKAGSTALDERRFGDALEAFTKAAPSLPRDSSIALGAGIAAFMLGQNALAQTWLERAVTLDPRDASAAGWLAELHYRAGRVKDAVAVVETALTASPEDRDLQERLAAWRKETQLQDRSYQSRGAHFVAFFEGPADDALARRVVERLEAAYWRIGTSLTTYPPEPITVVLYTLQQFRDITQMPAWSGGAYDGRIHVPVRGAFDDTAQLDRVLAHEFVHAVVGMLGGLTVPAWLNEGLASALEPDGSEYREAVLARTSSRPPLQQLHRSFSGLGDRDASVAYALSARAARRMIELRGAPAVVTLLQDLSRGAEFANAFHQRMAMRYEDFQALVARD